MGIKILDMIANAVTPVETHASKFWDNNYILYAAGALILLLWALFVWGAWKLLVALVN